MEELSPMMKKWEHLIDRMRAKFNTFIENKVLMHWTWFVAVWICAWMFLLYMTHILRIITWISVGLLAVYVSRWIQQVIITMTPKKLIRNTHNKAVLITGCDTGFGHNLAFRLHELGFKVFAGCLYPEGAGALELRRRTSERLRILHIDVTNEDTIQSAYTVIKQQLELANDRLWAVVNNAGIACVTEIEWCPMEIYKKVFDVNTLGLIRMTKTFLPLVRKNEGNRIIIVASLAGRYTFPGFSAYSMSKHAAVSFADGLRLEMRKWKVSVHTVEPTLYRTPIAEATIFSENLDKMWEECPEDIKKSYGTAYLQDFRTVVCNHLGKAKPTEKLHEVVDAMVDAVAGETPQIRYVPSIQTQLRAHFLSSLPSDVLDNLLSKSQPKTPPADLQEKKKSEFIF